MTLIVVCLLIRSPGVDAQRREVQLVFGLEEESLAADFQYGGRLEGRGYDEQGQLGVSDGAVLGLLALPVEILQSSLEV